MLVRLFVATESPAEAGDFSFAIPGELVHFAPLVCDCPDCGCDRAMAGFVSHKATTGFMIRDLDIDADTFADLFFKTLSESGWVAKDSAEDRAWVRDWALEHMAIAASLPIGSPLRLQDGRVVVRAAA